MTAEPIIHTLARGGSARGLHYWLSWLDCPQRAALENERRDEPETQARFVQTYSGMLVGTIGHAYLEHFWKMLQAERGAAIDPVGVVRFHETYVDDDARKEATNCVSSLLRVIAADGPIPLSTTEVGFVEKEISSKDALMRFGVPEFTGRLDVALKLGSEHIAALKGHAANTELLNVDGAVGALKPGKWILDYKFLGSRDTNLLDRTLGSLQYAAYQMLFEELPGEEPAAGLIQICPFNVKGNPVRFTVVPSPSEDARAMVRNILVQAREAQERGPVPKPLDHNCYPYKGICPFHHAAGGPCKRF